MKTKKIRKITALASLLLILVMICGCQADTTGGGKKEKKQTLVIGSDNYEPFNYTDENGEPAGIDVEIAQEACRRMDVEPEFKQIVWDQKDRCLEEGTIDCLWGSFTMTEREKQYQWSGPYLYSRQMIVVWATGKIWRLQDLKGKRIAVQTTSKPEKVLMEHRDDNRIPKLGDIYSVSGMDEVYASMRKGYVDAIAGHESAMLSFMKSNPGVYRMLEESLYVSELGVAFEKGTHEAFAKELTQVLNQMKKDGTIRTIVEKYGLDADKAVGEDAS